MREEREKMAAERETMATELAAARSQVTIELLPAA